MCLIKINESTNHIIAIYYEKNTHIPPIWFDAFQYPEADLLIRFIQRHAELR